MSEKLLLRVKRVLTGPDLKEIVDAKVTIRNGKIESVAKDDGALFKEKGRVLEFPEHTLMPGLWNLHVHIQRRHLSSSDSGLTFRAGTPEIENSPVALKTIFAVKNAEAELKKGVTTIRDCSSGDHISLYLKKAVEDNILHGPRVISCGMGIAATGGHETHLYRGAIEADGADEIRKAVRGEIKKGADFIKFMASGGLGGFPDRESPDIVELTLEELKAGIVEAHARKRRTTAHAMGAESIKTCIDAGIDCIEHGVELTAELAERMAGNGICYVPTISGIKRVVERIRRSGKNDCADYLQEHVLEKHLLSVKMAIKHGLCIGTGTDTLGDIHEEIMILHQLGMTCGQALICATSNASAICGLDKKCGEITPGFRADMLIVKGNPLEDLDALNNIDSAYCNGEKV